MLRVIRFKEGVLGSSLIVASGLIFTFERSISIIRWIGESAPVKLKGSGSYPSEPQMVGIFDNLFVPFLFLLGLYFLGSCFFGSEKQKLKDK